MATVAMVFVITSALLVACLALKAWHTRSIAWSDGCQPPKKYPHKEPIFGLDLFIKARTLLRENRLLPEIAQRYADHGRTFETKSLGSCTINTIEPLNLHTVWVSSFNDWGVQPLRLPVQDTFCGRGFITTDGAQWEHSRQLLKPCFNKANISNLSFLEECLQKVFKRLPKDQSTVDFQVLLGDMVSPSRPITGSEALTVSLHLTSSSTRRPCSFSASPSTLYQGTNLRKLETFWRPLTTLCLVAEFRLRLAL